MLTVFKITEYALATGLLLHWQHYDGPNGSRFISILFHNFEFWIPNSEFRIPNIVLRIADFGIVKYMLCGQSTLEGILNSQTKQKAARLKLIDL